MKGKYNQWNRPLFRLLQHLAFWALSFFVFLHLFKSGTRPERIDYIYTFLFQASLLPAVYINLGLLLPRLGQRRRSWLYFPAVLALILFFSWLNYRFFDQWSATLLPDYFFISYFTWREVALFFAVYTGLTTLLKLSKSWFLVSGLQKEILEIEKQKAQVELKALKAQINPHFFFNTLNSIYAMAMEQDKRLPATVLQLADLMRYFLYDAGDRYIPLAKELGVLRDYITLQQLRSGEQLSVQWTQEGDPAGKQIAPLLLITFLENAFKHGTRGLNSGAFIHLRTSLEKNVFQFDIENSKGLVDPVDQERHKGMGLENVRRQLELLYPGKYSLVTRDEENRYLAKLQLEL